MRRIEISGAGGLTLVADRGGATGDPPVILLHGGGQTRHAWDSTAHALLDHGYQVLALDLRGHGESQWSPDGDYTLDVLAADLRMAASRFARPVVLVGASLGGLTSLLAAGEHEVDVRALLLVDVVPRMNAQGTAEIRAFMQAHPEGFDSIDAAARAISTFLPHRPAPDDASGLAHNLRKRPDGRYRWHWDPALLRHGGPTRDIDRLEHAARAITVPTCLIRGGLSRVVREEEVARLRELIPHAECATVDGADHMVAGDRADRFNRLLLDFLGRHPA